VSEDTVATKIKIKMGAVEVEYEGEESFLKEELPALLAAITELHRVERAQAKKNGKNDEQGDAGGDQDGDTKTAKVGTTLSVASKLKVKSGTDLILAALVRLALVKQQLSVPRKELLDEMQTATGFYKSSYSGNLTAYLTRLSKADKINEDAADKYSLKEATRKDLESRLAQ
jgi:hypothetical protein